MKNESYPRVYLYRRIVQAKMYIDAHYAEAADLDNIADEACFSKFHFLRLFKSAYGMTPHQYLVQVRMIKAQQLLEEGCSVAHACYAVGFTSIGSFTTSFRRYTGHAPAHYQAMRRKVREELKIRPLKFVPNCFAAANGWAE